MTDPGLGRCHLHPRRYPGKSSAKISSKKSAPDALYHQWAARPAELTSASPLEEDGPVLNKFNVENDRPQSRSIVNVEDRKLLRDRRWTVGNRKFQWKHRHSLALRRAAKRDLAAGVSWAWDAWLCRPSPRIIRPALTWAAPAVAWL